jgi:hypothetical protein
MQANYGTAYEATHGTSYSTVIIALLAVLVMLWVVSLVIKHLIMPKQLLVPKRSKNFAITYNLPLDMKHRLVEVTMYGKKHFLVLGGEVPVVMYADTLVTGTISINDKEEMSLDDLQEGLKNGTITITRVEVVDEEYED